LYSGKNFLAGVGCFFRGLCRCDWGNWQRPGIGRLGRAAFIIKKKAREEGGEEDLLDLIREAHREWMDALAYFDRVAEPDLVDYAIYRLGAAENRYRCLLRRARSQGQKAFDPATLASA